MMEYDVERSREHEIASLGRLIRRAGRNTSWIRSGLQGVAFLVIVASEVAWLFAHVPLHVAGTWLTGAVMMFGWPIVGAAVVYRRYARGRLRQRLSTLSVEQRAAVLLPFDKDP